MINVKTFSKSSMGKYFSKTDISAASKGRKASNKFNAPKAGDKPRPLLYLNLEGPYPEMGDD